MLSIQQCKRILENSGKKYSESEVKLIRQLLYQLANIDYDFYKESLRNGKKSDHILKSLDR